MEPSHNSLEFIKKEEGVVLHPYLDSAGIPTIGIGSTMHKSGQRVHMTDAPITLEHAMDLLKWEVENKSHSVSAFTKGVILNQNQYDALVSFAYNVGIGALQNSTLLKKVRINPSDPTIKMEFLKWCKIHVKGKVKTNAGLYARRQREADLYFSK